MSKEAVAITLGECAGAYQSPQDSLGDYSTGVSITLFKDSGRAINCQFLEYNRDCVFYIPNEDERCSKIKPCIHLNKEVT